MRLIDANRLFDAMQKIKGQFVVGIGEVVNTIDVFEQIKDAPTIDAAKVVRCGECKHMIADGRCMEFADDGIRPSATDFCSYGERREDGEA